MLKVETAADERTNLVTVEGSRNRLALALQRGSAENLIRVVAARADQEDAAELVVSRCRTREGIAAFVLEDVLDARERSGVELKVRVEKQVLVSILMTSAVAQTGAIQAKIPFGFTIAKQTLLPS